MAEEHYLTPEGAQALKAELAQLKGEERQNLAKRLRDAIQMGDLSENADYHKAKEDQSFLEGHILELEYLLHHAVMIDTSEKQRDWVQVGATVTVQEDDAPVEKYQLVGAKEADPKNGRISNESPVGRSLMDGRVGDVVTITTPDGSYRLKIVKIE